MAVYRTIVSSQIPTFITCSDKVSVYISKINTSSLSDHLKCPDVKLLECIGGCTLHSLIFTIQAPTVIPRYRSIEILGPFARLQL